MVARKVPWYLGEDKVRKVETIQKLDKVQLRHRKRCENGYCIVPLKQKFILKSTKSLIITIIYTQTLQDQSESRKTVTHIINLLLPLLGTFLSFTVAHKMFPFSIFVNINPHHHHVICCWWVYLVHCTMGYNYQSFQGKLLSVL